MAYTSTVTKQTVEKTKGADDFLITIHVKVEDEVPTIVFEKDYSQRYNSNTTIGDIITGFQNMIQKDWDSYVAEKTVFDNAAFDTAVSQIQTALDTYINA